MRTPPYFLWLPTEDAHVDFVWLAVVTAFFAGSDLLIRLLSSLQGEG
jgi:hypothetical protein